MRHAKVAEAPCERGDDAQSAVRRGCAARSIVALRHVKVARQRTGIVDDRVQSARLLHAEAYDDDERNGHEDRLDQVGERNGHEAAHHRVQHDHNAADDHCRMILHTKEAVEERADGLEAGRRVGNEENEDHDRRDAGEQMLLISEAAGEKVGDRDGAEFGRIPAQAARDDQPVEIRADGQTDGRPRHLRQSAEVGKARQTHQKVAAHIARLGAHGRDDGAHLAPAEVEVVRAAAAALFAKIHADEHHRDEIENDGHYNNDLCACHVIFSFSFR